MKDFTTEAKKFYAKIKKECNLEDSPSLAVLGQAAEALMRLRDAQQIIKDEGLVILDRFGQKKTHPAAIIERDSRNAFLKALNQLGIEKPDNDEFELNFD